MRPQPSSPHTDTLFPHPPLFRSVNKAQALVARALGVFSKYRDATSFALMPPAGRELGNATGFDLWLVDNTNMGHEKLLVARNQLLGMAAGDKRVAQDRKSVV